MRKLCEKFKTSKCFVLSHQFMNDMMSVNDSANIFIKNVKLVVGITGYYCWSFKMSIICLATYFVPSCALSLLKTKASCWNSCLVSVNIKARHLWFYWQSQSFWHWVLFDCWCRAVYFVITTNREASKISNIGEGLVPLNASNGYGPGLNGPTDA